MIYEIKSFNQKLGNILSKFPDNFNPNSEADIPLLSFLPKRRQRIIKKEIVEFRTKLILEFEKSNEETRNKLLQVYKESTNLHPFIPVNINDLNASKKTNSLIFRQALFAVMIEDLNCDLRDLTIYMNELSTIATGRNIDLKSLIEELIPMASDVSNIYKVSTKGFLKSYASGIGIGDIQLRYNS